LRTDNVEAISDKDRELGKDANRFSIDQNDKLSRWVIQSKWEAPVLDFTNVTADALDLSSNSVVEVSVRQRTHKDQFNIWYIFDCLNRYVAPKG
jgi:hypothetical protein